MDLLTQLNRAMEYLEEHICDEDALEGAARVTSYSPYHFGRIFFYIAEMPLSEYLRKRRLSLAAMELQSSGSKIIDLAVKYGYESADSFTRAFAKLHGATPSSARKAGVSLKSYPMLTFQIKIRGVHEMNWRIEEKEAFSVYGIERVFQNDELGRIPAFWEEARAVGRLERLSGHGLMIGCCRGSGDATVYMIGAFLDGNSDTVGFETVALPKQTWAVFRRDGLCGHMECEIPELFNRAYSEWLPSSGFDKADGPDLEVYGDDYEEVWIPVVRKQ